MDKCHFFAKDAFFPDFSVPPEPGAQLIHGMRSCRVGCGGLSAVDGSVAKRACVLAVHVVVLHLRVDHPHFFDVLGIVELSVLKYEKSILVAPRGDKEPHNCSSHPYMTF